jgi:hypothetical protein
MMKASEQERQTDRDRSRYQSDKRDGLKQRWTQRNYTGDDKRRNRDRKKREKKVQTKKHLHKGCENLSKVGTGIVSSR